MAVLDCSRSTVLRLIEAGELGAPVKIRRSIRVWMREVLESVRRLHKGLQSFLSMSRIEAR
jgi:hypothetical protein